MGTLRHPNAWAIGLAVGLVLRPLLIAPMTPSGPLAGSFLLPVGWILLVALHLALAAGVLVDNRLAIGFSILTAVLGVPFAILGAYVGLPEPWALVVGVLNVVLVWVGIEAWRSQRRTPEWR